MKCPRCAFANSSEHPFCAECGVMLSPQEKADPFIGRSLLQQFRIVKKIGEGGFGAVYLADQPSMGRQAAIKILHKHLAHRADLAKRFHREGLAASRVEHPSAVTMYNFGETEDGILWIAMEFLHGETLDQRIKRQRLSPEELIQVLRPICEVLYEAHQKGIIHRDLKPENIFLAKTSQEKITPKLLDFGIAGLLESQSTQSNVISGTPRYMPPEQWKGLKFTDVRSDLYALGVVVYQALTAKLPFEADSAPEWMQRHCLEEPKPLIEHTEITQINRALNAVIMRVIAKEPSRRYQNAMEFFRALEAAAKGAELFPVLAGPTSLHQRLSWLGSYQGAQLISQGDSFWVYQATWEGTPVRVKVPALAPKAPWISWQTTSTAQLTETKASAAVLDEASSKSALQAALFREHTIIQSTNGEWNHKAIALDNWSLGGFCIGLVTQDHQGKTFATLSHEERRFLFPRMLLALWKALRHTPHGAFSEESLFLAEDLSHFVIADPGVLLWQETQAEGTTMREALLLTEQTHYPVLAPFEDTEDLLGSLQTPGALGQLPLPKSPPEARPLASDMMALGLVYYRLLTGENLFFGDVLPQPAWFGARSSVDSNASDGRLVYQAVYHALNRNYVLRKMKKHQHITEKEAALVEALVMCRMKTVPDLLAYLW